MKHFKQHENSPLSVFIFVDSDPESWKEVEVPTNSFNTSHETQVHKRLTEDIARYSCSEEDVEELVIGLVESFNG